MPNIYYIVAIIFGFAIIFGLCFVQAEIILNICRSVRILVFLDNTYMRTNTY